MAIARDYGRGSHRITSCPSCEQSHTSAVGLFKNSYSFRVLLASLLENCYKSVFGGFWENLLFVFMSVLFDSIHKPGCRDFMSPERPRQKMEQEQTRPFDTIRPKVQRLKVKQEQTHSSAFICPRMHRQEVAKVETRPLHDEGAKVALLRHKLALLMGPEHCPVYDSIKKQYPHALGEAWSRDMTGPKRTVGRQIISNG